MAIKKTKKAEKKEIEKDSSEEMDLDDALDGMDEDTVQSGVSKKKKNKGLDEAEMEEELELAEKELDGSQTQGSVTVKASKPATKIKKGDKIRVDGEEFEVDAHYVLIDHKGTKEMAIEIFNPKTDKDYQLRYFSDQIESTIEFYELQDILYVKKNFSSVEW